MYKQAIALPLYCHCIAIVLPLYCHCIAIVLPLHCDCITSSYVYNTLLVYRLQQQHDGGDAEESQCSKRSEQCKLLHPGKRKTEN